MFRSFLLTSALTLASSCQLPPPVEDPENLPPERTKMLFATLDFEVVAALPVAADSDQIAGEIVIRVPADALNDGVSLLRYELTTWVDENRDGERQRDERSEQGSAESDSSIFTTYRFIPYTVGAPIGYELTVVTTRSRTTVRGQVDPW